MPIHSNEYMTTSGEGTRHVVADPAKIKYNNVQTCIAVGVCVYNQAGALTHLLGAHFTVFTISSGEITNAIQEFQNSLTALNGNHWDIVLIGSYEQNYRTNNLIRQLTPLEAETISVYNIPIITGDACDIDVKIQNGGNQPLLFARRHIARTNILKDKYDPAKPGGAAMPIALVRSHGYNSYVNDRDNKPWQSLNVPTIRLRRVVNWRGSVSYK